MAARKRARPTSRAAAVALPRRVAVSPRLYPSRASVALGLAVFAAAGGAYAVARTTPMFAVADVQVTGGSPAVRRQVASALAPEVGTSLLKVDGALVTRRLAAVPWVADATYDRSFPHTLVVRVRPERPVAVLRRGAKSWLVSARGRVVAELPRHAESPLPRIWIGAKVQPPTVGAILGDAQGGRAARTLAPLQGVHFPVGIAAATAGEDELTLVLRSGAELRLGDGGDLRLKLAVARRVLRRIGYVGPGGYVDVSVPERPVASVNPQVEG